MALSRPTDSLVRHVISQSYAAGTPRSYAPMRANIARGRASPHLVAHLSALVRRASRRHLRAWRQCLAARIWRFSPEHHRAAQTEAATGALEPRLQHQPHAPVVENLSRSARHQFQHEQHSHSPRRRPMSQSPWQLPRAESPDWRKASV